VSRTSEHKPADLAASPFPRAERGPGEEAPALRWAVAERLAFAAVLLGAAAFALVFAYLNTLRHLSLGTNAFDLGYFDQAVWNTLHGRFFRATALVGATFQIGEESGINYTALRDVGSTLAFHVEPLLLLIAPLYLLRSDPTTLLWLQAAVIASGALPAYWLARDRLKSPLAGVAIAALYLLAAPTQGAAAADFYAVSFTAALLLFAWSFMDAQRWPLFWLFLLLALATKEDISLLVAMVGLYLIVVRREPRHGLVALAVGLGWFVLTVQVIIPTFAGEGGSPLLSRYRALGESVGQILVNLVLHPTLAVRQLGRPDVVTYTLGLLGAFGFLPLLNPPTLLLAAPSYAINALSSYPWMFSGGNHYSAPIVPFLVVSAVYGLARLRLVARALDWSPRLLVGLALVAALAIGLGFHRKGALVPFGPRLDVPQVTAHHRRLAGIVAQMPPHAIVAAQSNVFPHVSQRPVVYLFPAVNDAEYVLLDATGDPYPVGLELLRAEARRLLAGDFGVAAAQDGYLLLRRGAPERTLPPSFFAFARDPDPPPEVPLRFRLGEDLEFLGTSVQVVTQVNFRQRQARVVTYWRALRPLPRNYRPWFFFTRTDGALAGIYNRESMTTAWLPPTDWPVGETVRIILPPLPVGNMQDVLVAVREDPVLGTWLPPQADLPGFDRLVVPIDRAPTVRVYRLADPALWLRTAADAGGR
jgi:uncharacterized membrane protein